jgi:hypothetical protein
MSEKAVLVHGATVKCNFSVAPQTDKLVVLSQQEHYVNDKEGSEKLIGTTMELGQTLEKNTFGNCKLQPTGNSYLPCKAVITKWDDFYDHVTLSNNGNILLKKSKATCPIGGAGCISVVNHGQKSSGSTQQQRKVDSRMANAVNPLGNAAALQQENEQIEEDFAE